MSHDPFAHPAAPDHPAAPENAAAPAHPPTPENAVAQDDDGRKIAIIVLSVVAAVTLMAVVFGAFWLLNRDEGETVAAASPSPTTEESADASPVPETEEETNSWPMPDIDEDDTNPSPVPEDDEQNGGSSPAPEVDQEALARAEALGFTPVAYEMDIEEISDYYKELQSSLELFDELIPATEEGAEYVHAFMLVIADHKAATMFGGAFDGESRDKFAQRELQFLTVSDMDINIKITRTDGSVFEHDGTAPKPVD